MPCHGLATPACASLAVRWIVCLDADCIPASSYFEVLDGVLSDASPRLLTGPRIFVQADALRANEIVEDASVLSRLPRVASASNYGLSVDRRCRWLGRIDRVEHPWALFHGCNMVFQRDRALAAGGFDEGYDGTWGFEDVDFAWRLIAHQDCRPGAVDALRVYHQEPDRDHPQPDRFNRTDNPNWARICNRIPGFEAFKRGQYKEIGLPMGEPAAAGGPYQLEGRERSMRLQAGAAADHTRTRTSPKPKASPENSTRASATIAFQARAIPGDQAMSSKTSVAPFDASAICPK